MTLAIITSSRMTPRQRHELPMPTTTASRPWSCRCVRRSVALLPPFVERVWWKPFESMGSMGV
eukprot:4823540-Prymnesium_polylepis.1